MPDNSISFVTGTYQQFDGNNVSFSGVEARYSGNRGYLGGAVSAGTNNLKNLYGIIDFKGKLNYDNKGIVDQNIRVRTTFDNNLGYTQIRYSPCTVTVPLGKKTSAYVNPHYVAKYDYNNKEWKHSAGWFAGVTQGLGNNSSISLEVQRYNAQNIHDNSAQNYSGNIIFTKKF